MGLKMMLISSFGMVYTMLLSHMATYQLMAHLMAFWHSVVLKLRLIQVLT